MGWASKIRRKMSDNRKIIIDESLPVDSPRYRFFIYEMDGFWYLRVL
jgi:hypothetical protein